MSMNIDSKLNNENGFWDVSLQGELDVSTADKLKTDNKEIYIINPKSNVKKIFTITGLDKIFKVEG